MKKQMKKRTNPSIPKLAATVAATLCCAIPAHAASLYQASLLPDVFHATAPDGGALGIQSYPQREFDVGAYGSLVGNLGSNLARPGEEVGFRYQDGALSLLAVAGYTDSRAAAVNSGGGAAGSVYNAWTGSGETGEQAVLWRLGGPKLLGTLGGSTSRATGINDRFTVVGTSQVAGDGHAEAFIWNAGGAMQPLLAGGQPSTAAGINNRGDVIGSVAPAGGNTASQPFVYIDGQLQLMGATLEQAGLRGAGFVRISDTRTVLGNAWRDAFTLRDGVVTVLEDLALDPQLNPDFNFTTAADINNRGEAVGFSLEGLYQQRATLWTNGQVTDLNDVLDGALGEGVWLTRAVGIDSTSHILAIGSDERIYRLTPVPEPSSLALCALGLAVAGWAGTRRGRKAA